jgi:hypothetical protein
VPDWCLPVPMGGYSGLWIEFKYGKNKLSDNQQDYIALLEAAGHCVDVAYTTEEAIRVTEEYLSQKRVFSA